jgi:hypothetical protein
MQPAKYQASLAGYFIIMTAIPAVKFSFLREQSVLSIALKGPGTRALSKADHGVNQQAGKRVNEFFL